MNINFGTKGSNRARALELMRSASGCEWITKELAQPVLDVIDDSVFINDPSMHGGNAAILGGRDQAHRAEIYKAMMKMLAGKPGVAVAHVDDAGAPLAEDKVIE